MEQQVGLVLERDLCLCRVMVTVQELDAKTRECHPRPSRRRLKKSEN